MCIRDRNLRALVSLSPARPNWSDKKYSHQQHLKALGQKPVPSSFRPPAMYSEDRLSFFPNGHRHGGLPHRTGSPQVEQTLIRATLCTAATVPIRSTATSRRLASVGRPRLRNCGRSTSGRKVAGSATKASSGTDSSTVWTVTNVAWLTAKLVSRQHVDIIDTWTRE